jgi:hypothetical protein
VLLFVGSSFGEGPGTLIGDDPTPSGATNDRPPAPEALAPIRPGRIGDDGTGRYRPLTMTRCEPIDSLELRTSIRARAAAWRTVLAAQRDETALLAEWLDDAPAAGNGEFRWTGLGAPDALNELRRRLRAAAAPAAGEETFAEDLVCLSLVGGRPRSWLAVEERIAAALTAWRDLDWRLRADGSIVRLLVPAGVDTEVAQALHAALF